MVLSNPKLLPLQISLVVALFAMLLANKVHSQDGVNFHISRFPSDLLTLQGDAHVPAGTSFLRLTAANDSSDTPLPQSVGRALYSDPVHLWDLWSAARIETHISFFITPVDDKPADGMTFFIAPVGSTIPDRSAGGNLGIFDSSGPIPIFAVEFDTYVNSWDPWSRHIGIDIEYRISMNCALFETELLGHLVTARISYDPETRQISVSATAGSETFEVSDFWDLRAVLPRDVQVGLSASTGADVALHDIVSWNFSSTLVSAGTIRDKGDALIRQYV